MNCYSTRILCGAILMFAIVHAGCSDDTACSNDSDCFAGEYCSSDKICVEGPRPANNANNLNNANNQNNVNNVNNVNNSNSLNNVNNSNNLNNVNNQNNLNNLNNLNNQNNANNPNNEGLPACVVDLFGHQCENDNSAGNDAPGNEELVLEPTSWCADGTLVNGVQTFRGKLCPAEPGDYWRIMIDNRTPDACLSPTVSMRITVDFEAECRSEYLTVLPYYFGANPHSRNLCVEDENLSCEIENEGQTYVFEWVRDSSQIFDTYLMVRAERMDLDLDYTVTIEIL